MPTFSVSKSIVIHAPQEEVYDYVRDFSNWPEWSPWIVAEPDCRLFYDYDGNGYNWEGKIIGSGAMKVVGEEKPNSIHYDLQFLKPWKSQADVSFLFKQADGGVEVTWTLESALPFFMFFMKKMMVAMVGMDYQRGLMMLKDRVETGTNPCRLSFGEKTYGPIHYIGLTRECSTREIGPSMEEAFPRLHAMLEETEIQPVAPPMAIYHKFDPVREFTRYTLAMPVSEPRDVPSGFVSGDLPEMKAYTVTLTGPYRHLPNAWAAGMMRSRAKVFASRRDIRPFEVYESDPENISEDGIVTVVYFPVKDT